MGVIVLTDDNFASEVIEAGRTALVDFWAEWCGPCRMVAPVVEEIAKDFEGKLKVGKLNVDEAQNTAAKYNIMSIPTLVVFKGGEEVERIIGALPRAAIDEKIAPHL